MTQLTSSGEVAVYIDVDQFQPGHSTMKCGFYAAAQSHFAGQPGHPARGSAADIRSLADSWYIKDDGADTASNGAGMELPQLYAMIKSIGDHYQNLFPDALPSLQQGDLKALIRQWLKLGYEVIIAVDENSVRDMELNACPYSWAPAPGQYSHVISLTGLQSNGIDFLARDTANIAPEGVRPGPRRYAATPLRIWTATLFIHDWQSRPAGPRPPAPAPAPPSSTDWKKQALAAMASLQEALGHL